MFNFLKTPTFGQTYTCVCNGQSSIIAQLYWDIIFEPLNFELVTISIRFTLHHCWLFFLHRLQFGIDDNVWIALWKLCKDKEERGEILALKFIEQWYTEKTLFTPISILNQLTLFFGVNLHFSTCKVSHSVSESTRSPQSMTLVWQMNDQYHEKNK